MNIVTGRAWLTVAAAATYARIGWKLIYREVAAGRLRAARIGGRRTIRPMAYVFGN